MKRTYREYSYDVWGNARDGWEVNDVYRGNLVTIDDSKDIVSELRKAGLLARGVRAASVKVEGEPGYTWYVTDARQKACDKPAFELRYEGVV